MTVADSLLITLKDPTGSHGVDLDQNQETDQRGRSHGDDPRGPLQWM